MVLFYNYSKDKTKKRRVFYKMLEGKIVELREKLNKSIESDEKYEIIYNLSVELDDLIAKYYFDAWYFKCGND